MIISPIFANTGDVSYFVEVMVTDVIDSRPSLPNVFFLFQMGNGYTRGGVMLMIILFEFAFFSFFLKTSSKDDTYT